jgi:hypothetical protein
MDLVALPKNTARRHHEAGRQVDREDGVVLGLTDTDISDREVVDQAYGQGS